MDALAAQGKIKAIPNQHWTALSAYQRRSILDLLPLTISISSDDIQSYLPDIETEWDWYAHRVLKLANMSTPSALGLVKICKEKTSGYVKAYFLSLEQTLAEFQKLTDALICVATNSTDIDRNDEIYLIIESLSFEQYLKLKETDNLLLVLAPFASNLVELGIEVPILAKKVVLATPGTSLFQLPELNLRSIDMNSHVHSHRLDLDDLHCSIELGDNILHVAQRIFAPVGLDIESLIDIRAVLNRFITESESFLSEPLDWSSLYTLKRHQSLGLDAHQISLAKLIVSKL